MAGQRTAINLGGVEVADVSRGQTLVTPDTLSVTRRVDAVVDLLPSAKAAEARRACARAQRHRAKSWAACRSPGRRRGDRGRSRRALVRLRLEQPAVLTRGDRFIIRAYSPPITIGGGRVLDPAPTRPGVRSAEGVASLERLAASAAERDRRTVIAMIAGAGLAGMATVVAGVARRRAADSRCSRRAGTRARLASSWPAIAWWLPPHLKKAGKALIKIVTAFHDANPLSEGLPREEASEKMFRARGAGHLREGDRRSQGGESAGWHRSAGAAHAPATRGGRRRAGERRDRRGVSRRRTQAARRGRDRGGRERAAARSSRR